MKYLPLVWSGLWRKPGRTILIFLQVSVAFALFGVLQGLKTGVAHAVAAARADLLIVHSRLSSIAQPLPYGLLEQIRSVPGVQVAIPVELTGGTWQKPDQGIGIVAVSPEGDWTRAFTYTIPPEYLAAFGKSRTAMLVRDLAAQKYGWKVGDHIPLNLAVAQQNGSNDWAFDVVGIFTDSDVGGGRYIVLVSYPYFDEARALKKGTVNHFNIAVSDRQSDAANLLESQPEVESVQDKNGVMVVKMGEGVNQYSFLANRLIENGFELTLFKEDEINLETAFMHLTKGITS